MSKRGRVLRDPHMGPGLLIVEGKQYPFLMDGLWRSEVPAKPGLIVNVDFDTQGNLNGITAVPQSQLDRERAELKPPASSFRNVLLESWAAGTGNVGRITTAGLLSISWFFLTAVSIHLPFSGNLDLTFWQVLGYLNIGNFSQVSDVTASPDPGIFGFLAILALVGLFLPYVWKDRHSWLGGLLPLFLMMFVAFKADVDLHSAFVLQSGGSRATPPISIWSAISIGLGTYLSATFAIGLTVLSAKQWMVSRRVREAELGRSQQQMAA